jgi:hypothetical protein
MTLKEFEALLKKRLKGITHKGTFGVRVITLGYYSGLKASKEV